MSRIYHFVAMAACVNQATAYLSFTARRSAPPLQIVGMPGFEKLTDDEREVCAFMFVSHENDIVPAVHLIISLKTIITLFSIVAYSYYLIFSSAPQLVCFLMLTWILRRYSLMIVKRKAIFV